MNKQLALAYTLASEHWKQLSQTSSLHDLSSHLNSIASFILQAQQWVRNSQQLYRKLPQVLLAHTFSFLMIAEAARASTVAHSWHAACSYTQEVEKQQIAHWDCTRPDQRLVALSLTAQFSLQHAQVSAIAIFQEYIICYSYPSSLLLFYTFTGECVRTLILPKKGNAVRQYNPRLALAATTDRVFIQQGNHVFNIDAKATIIQGNAKWHFPMAAGTCQCYRFHDSRSLVSYQDRLVWSARDGAQIFLMQGRSLMHSGFQRRYCNSHSELWDQRKEQMAKFLFATDPFHHPSLLPDTRSRPQIVVGHDVKQGLVLALNSTFIFGLNPVRAYVDVFFAPTEPQKVEPRPSYDQRAIRCFCIQETGDTSYCLAANEYVLVILSGGQLFLHDFEGHLLAKQHVCVKLSPEEKRNLKLTMSQTLILVGAKTVVEVYYIQTLLNPR